MYDFTKIKDNALIICPTSIKEQIILYFNTNLPFNDFKILSKTQLIEELTFSYEIDAVIYITKTCNYSLEIAEEILKNMPLITKGTEKMNLIYDIYLDLLNKKLLKVNAYFDEYLQNKNIYICGYSKKDLELTNLLFSKGYRFEFLENIPSDYLPVVYEFETEIEEVRYVFSKIAELYNHGISLNNIYIYNLPSEYELIFKKYLYYHEIEFDSFNYINLYDSEIYKTFISLLKDNTLTDAYNKLLQEITYDPFLIIDSITNLVVSITSLKLKKEEQIEILNYLAKKKQIKSYNYEEMLKSCNSNTILTKDDYVFMLGFSQNSYPKIYKNIDMFTDNEKSVMNKNTSNIKNEIEKEDLINFIHNTKNLFISYKKQVGKMVYYPSILIKELGLKIKKQDLSNIRYSEKLLKLEIAGYYDKKRLYGINNKFLSTYTKQELKYNTFNHTFKPFKIESLADQLELSYTQIEEYNNCPFKYYLKRILRIDTSEETFDINIGKIFHKMLEKSILEKIDLNNYQQEINEKFSTASSKFLFNLLIKQILNVIEKNNNFKEHTCYTLIHTEEDCTFNLDLNTTFTGKMDKVMIDEKNSSLIIIDYKTGTLKFEPNKFIYGLNLQLPIYILLAEKKYENYTCTGIFIQQVLEKKPKKEMEKNYLLRGLAVSDITKLRRLDNEVGTKFDDEGKKINKSNYINGLVFTSSGTLNGQYKTARPKQELDEYKDIALEQINNTKENIRNGIFDISPVFFKEKDNACCFCEFKDVCFKEEEDYRYYELKDNKEDEEDE